MFNFRTIDRATLTCVQRLAQTALCIICVPFIGVFSINAVASTAVGLESDEQLLASKLADNQAWQQQRSSLNSNPHRLGIQTLSIELDERKKDDRTRRARVYQFNYHLKQSRLVLIDLANAIITKQQVINSVHLPLNSMEISTARLLVEQHTQIMQKLNTIRSRRGMPNIANLSTIEVKASIFEPDEQQHLCASQRCALISLFDETRTVFSVEPLVNLQSLSVTTLQQRL